MGDMAHRLTDENTTVVTYRDNEEFHVRTRARHTSPPPGAWP
ncbi:hypothetical protein [Streptomyces jumonjinensis]